MNRLLQAAGRTAIVVFCSSPLIFVVWSPPRGSHSSIAHAQSTQPHPHPHSVDLKWKASGSRVVGYYVYRSEKAEGPYIKLTSTPVRQTNYTDRSVQSGHTYFYKVTAVDSKGHESVFSKLVQAIVPAP